MKLVLIVLCLASVVCLNAQCPTMASDFSSGTMTITMDCPPLDINESFGLFSAADIDIQSGGSLTINFTGGTPLFDHGDGTFDVDGDLNINNGDLAIQYFVSDPNFTISASGTVNVPNGSLTVGLNGESNTTSMVLDGELYLDETTGDFVANSGAVLTGAGCFNDTDNTINTSDDPGANISGFTGTSPCMPAPVELYSFDAKLVSKTVELEWITVSEINNQGFEVQRSFDGTNFTSIGFVNGHGNTNEKITYSYVDRIIPSNTTYYRLKQIDFDGVFEYSPIRMIDTDAFTAVPTVYPTYVQNFLHFEGDPNAIYQLLVVNFAGQTMIRIDEPTKLNELEELLNEHVGSFFPSTYVIQLLDINKRRHSIRFVKR